MLTTSYYPLPPTYPFGMYTISSMFCSSWLFPQIFFCQKKTPGKPPQRRNVWIKVQMPFAACRLDLDSWIFRCSFCEEGIRMNVVVLLFRCFKNSSSLARISSWLDGRLALVQWIFFQSFFSFDVEINLFRCNKGIYESDYGVWDPCVIGWCPCHRVSTTDGLADCPFIKERWLLLNSRGDVSK